LSAEDDDDDDATAASPATALQGCDPTHSTLYCVYEVQEGDTLGKIAERAGLTSNEDVANWEYLVHSNKPEIIDEFQPLQIGQKIRVPYGNGSLHTVLSAQTLFEIAEQYGVTVEQIIAVNAISDPDSISIGNELLIPNPTRFAPIYVPDETTPDPDDSEDGSEDNSGDIVGGGGASASGFMWPVGGPISSYYGPGHPLGIDIDLFNNAGAPIGAAMGGVVTFAGGNACCSYGYYVVIDHGNGYTSLYGHLSSIGVSVGEVVAQGEYLGNGGSTGYSTGDHLHFEIHSGGAVVNPLNLLP
jgi:murein DD-endopeptidase MepM/ murein hydrolase activator NlpD